MRGLFLALFLFLPLAAPAQEAGADAQPQPPLPALVLNIGPARLTAEVARTPEQLERGLMFRRRMDDNAGMLFVLGAEERATFWMKNTILPLSVAYLDKTGRIVEIHDMVPYDTTPVYSASDKIAYALETNQGWFALNKVPPGTPVRPAGARFGKAPLSPGT